jgi:hypothetical protein
MAQRQFNAIEQLVCEDEKAVEIGGSLHQRLWRFRQDRLRKSGS